MIPPEQNGNFVACMEKVLEIYKRPYDPMFPVVCMDESPKQLIEETKIPIAVARGKIGRYDYEYKRHGVCNIFMACEPLVGKRLVKITERKTKTDWACFLEEIATLYSDAKRITLVMDNFSTHTPGSFYKAFRPAQAKQLWDRFDFVFTPKHGSWLNMAEIELNVLTGQCLNRRIDKIEDVRRETTAWQDYRNNKKSIVNWQFSADDARIKLARLYPSIDT